MLLKLLSLGQANIYSPFTTTSETAQKNKQASLCLKKMRILTKFSCTVQQHKFRWRQTPWKKIHVTAHYSEIKLKDVPFEGLVQYNLSNGASFAQKVCGYYNGIYNCYTSIKVKKTTVAKYNEKSKKWNVVPHDHLRL